MCIVIVFHQFLYGSATLTKMQRKRTEKKTRDNTVAEGFSNLYKLRGDPVPMKKKMTKRREGRGREEREGEGNGVRGEAPAKFLKRVFRPFPGVARGREHRKRTQHTKIFLLVNFGAVLMRSCRVSVAQNFKRGPDRFLDFFKNWSGAFFPGRTF